MESPPTSCDGDADGEMFLFESDIMFDDAPQPPNAWLPEACVRGGNAFKAFALPASQVPADAAQAAVSGAAYSGGAQQGRTAERRSRASSRTSQLQVIAETGDEEMAEV